MRIFHRTARRSPLKSTIQQISYTDSDIWLYDTVRGVKTRFTAKARDGQGTLLVARRETHCFQLKPAEVICLYEKSADGSGNEELFVRVGDWKVLPGLGAKTASHSSS